MAPETKARLEAAAGDVLRIEGITGLSARAIAARAGLNQALIFYHFGTVAALVQSAVRVVVDSNVEFYRERFAEISSLVELLELGRTLHEQEREAGNVMMMAQLMAGAQQDSTLAAGARYAMDRWVAEIETVVRRVLTGSPIAEIADAAGLARAISAGFLGFELFEGIDPDGAASALNAIEQLGVLVEMVDDLGPVARRALRASMRRRARRARTVGTRTS